MLRGTVRMLSGNTVEAVNDVKDVNVEHVETLSGRPREEVQVRMEEQRGSRISLRRRVGGRLEVMLLGGLDKVSTRTSKGGECGKETERSLTPDAEPRERARAVLLLHAELVTLKLLQDN